MAFYKNRFADASDFTFVFVGSIDVPAMKPLVERYLASLPSIRRVEAAMDRGVRSPPGVVELQVVKGVDPRSQVDIVCSGPFQNDQMHRVLVKTMAENGEDIADVFNMRPFYDRLTTASLRDAAREYLNVRRHVPVTLRPEAR